MPYKNKEEHKAAQRRWVRARRQRGIEYLGGICAVCGSTEHLEFDHVDPNIKETVMSRRWSYKWERVLEELNKCQLLCYDCHKKKTFTRSSLAD